MVPLVADQVVKKGGGCGGKEMSGSKEGIESTDL